MKYTNSNVGIQHENEITRKFSRTHKKIVLSSTQQVLEILVDSNLYFSTNSIKYIRKQFLHIFNNSISIHKSSTPTSLEV